MTMPYVCAASSIADLATARLYSFLKFLLLLFVTNTTCCQLYCHSFSPTFLFLYTLPILTLRRQNIQNSQDVPDTIEKGIVIEFKLDASSIIDDLKDDIKALNDIDLLVCWDVDESEFSKEHITIEPVKKDGVIYYRSNKKAIFPINFGAVSGELPILSLKGFINEQLR